MKISHKMFMLFFYKFWVMTSVIDVVDLLRMRRKLIKKTCSAPFKIFLSGVNHGNSSNFYCISGEKWDLFNEENVARSFKKKTTAVEICELSWEVWKDWRRLSLSEVRRNERKEEKKEAFIIYFYSHYCVTMF